MPAQPTIGVGVSLVFFIFFLVPGFIGVKSYLWATRNVDYLSRFDKLGAATLVGVLTLPIPIELHSFAISSISWYPWAEFPPTLAGFGSIPITLLVIGVVVQSGGAILLGGMVGYLQNNFGRKPKRDPLDKDRPWRYGFGHRNNLQEVTITTDGDDLIRGRVLRYGSDPEDFDILLAAPKLIDTETGEITKEYQGYRYFHDQSIHQIHFHDTYPLDDEREEKVGIRILVKRLFLFVYLLPRSLLTGAAEWLRRQWQQTEDRLSNEPVERED